MLKKLLLLLITPCILSYALAQDRTADSLRAVMASATTDSVRVTATLQLGHYFKSVQFDSSRYYYQLGMEDAVKNNYQRGVAAAFGNIGVTYGMQGDYPLAISHFEKALAHAMKNGITDLQMTQYNNLGIVYRRLGDYSKSYDYYLQAMSLADSLGNEKEMAGHKYGIGVLHDLMGEPELAMKLFREAMDIFEKHNEMERASHLYSGMGVIHANARNYDSALYYYEIALTRNKETGEKENEITTMNNIGQVYRKIGDFNKAEQILKEALQNEKSLQLPLIKSSILYNLTQVYLATHQYKLALSYAMENLENAKALGSFNQLMDAHEVLSRVHEQNNDFTDALDSYKKFYAYRDSLFNENKTKEFKIQQTRYDVHKMDQEMARQQLELAYLTEKGMLDQRWKYALLAASVFLLLTLILGYQKYKYRMRHNQLLQAKNAVIVSQNKDIEEMNTVLETRMLRAQMNPHFIFNSLSSIQHFVTTNDKVSALRYLTKFSNLLRKVLETSASVQVSLAEELSLIKIYLELETLRFDGEFEYEISIDPQLDIHAVEMPLLMIQPYIENAILHGLLPSDSDRKFLKVDFNQCDHALIITIEDNGIGREGAKQLQEKSIYKKQSYGMSVTEKRLQMLHKNGTTIPIVGVTDLYDNNGKALGTRVEISIPQNANIEALN